MADSQNILIIEDDFFIRDLYEKQFGKEGYAVVSVPSAEEGLEKIKAVVPNLLLLDLMLPKMTGLELLKIIKNDTTLKTLPVIILTNLGQDQAIKQAFDLGADGYLVKSAYTPTQVVEEVRRFIK